MINLFFTEILHCFKNNIICEKEHDYYRLNKILQPMNKIICEDKEIYYIPNYLLKNQNDNIDMSLLILFDYHSYMHNLIISEIKDRILERKFNYFLSVQEYEEDDENVPPTFNKLFKFFEGCNSKFIQFEQYKINIFYDFTEISNKYDQKTIIWYDEFFEKELVESNNKKIFYISSKICNFFSGFLRTAPIAAA